MAQSYPSYSWKAMEVTTSDDYILTMFHVWNEETRDASKGPVLFQHSLLNDGTSWLELTDNQPSFIIKVADLGHDVYIGNNRGTEYSQKHVTLDAAEDQEQYWDFTWHNMAEDVLAEI